jgi:limonene-1,2-epoxide hydrolase
MSSTEIVQRFFDDFARLDVDAILEHFTEDAVYHDIPVPTDPAVGRAAIRTKLDYLAPVDHMVFDISNMVADGDTVLAERVETWHFRTGETVALPVMCTIEVRDGKVAVWREYWDFQTLMSQLPQSFLDSLPI